jgi:hypothetical protein
MSEHESFHPIWSLIILTILAIIIGALVWIHREESGLVGLMTNTFV